jgi:hypothetical protein
MKTTTYDEMVEIAKRQGYVQWERSKVIERLVMNGGDVAVWKTDSRSESLPKREGYYCVEATEAVALQEALDRRAAMEEDFQRRVKEADEIIAKIKDALEPKYYVQDSRIFTGNSVTWWGPDGKGYTNHIDKAGKYTKAMIVGMRDTDIPWPVEQIDKIWSHHVDAQHLPHRETCIHCGGTTYSKCSPRKCGTCGNGFDTFASWPISP